MHWLGKERLMGMMRNSWERGYSVVFHCNKGDLKAPATASWILEQATGVQARLWVQRICMVRQVDNLLSDFNREINENSNDNWVPDNFRDYLLVCRIQSWKLINSGGTILNLK